MVMLAVAGPGDHIDGNERTIRRQRPPAPRRWRRDPEKLPRREAGLGVGNDWSRWIMRQIEKRSDRDAQTAARAVAEVLIDE